MYGGIAEKVFLLVLAALTELWGTSKLVLLS